MTDITTAADMARRLSLVADFLARAGVPSPTEVSVDTTPSFFEETCTVAVWRDLDQEPAKLVLQAWTGSWRLVRGDFVAVLRPDDVPGGVTLRVCLDPEVRDALVSDATLSWDES